MIKRKSSSGEGPTEPLKPPIITIGHKKPTSIRPNFDDFEFDPLSSAASRRKSSTVTTSTTSNSTNTGSSLTYSSMTQDRSLFDDTANDWLKKHTEKEQQKLKIKEAGQLASVFLEIRKGIMTENNIDVSHNDRIDQDRENAQKPRSTVHISKSALHRAERVKLMLNFYYYAITESLKPTNPKYVGVDGVYNPLQIIRNRKIRKKYHQVPTISVKTLPPASTVFSTRKDKKLLWEVTLAELVYDSTWRSQHWYELRNSRGELWFPDPTLRYHGHHGHKHFHHRHRRPSFIRHHSNETDSNDEEQLNNIHGKLFDSVDDEEEEDRYKEEESNDDYGYHEDEDDEDARDYSDEAPSRYTTRNTLNSSREDFLDVPRSGRKESKREKITNRLRSKSPFKKISKSSTINSSVSELAAPVRLDTALVTDSLYNNADDVSVSGSSSVSQHKSKILGDVIIEPMRQRSGSSSSNALLLSSSLQVSPSQNIGPLDTQEQPQDENHTDEPLTNLELEEMKRLNGYWNELTYLNNVIELNQHDYEVISESYNKAIKLEKFNHIYQEISVNAIDLKANKLANYSNVLKTNLDDLTKIQNELINDYSTRVDKLLTLSDRTIGEVNTTLSLEIRKLTERFEKSTTYLSIHNNKKDFFKKLCYLALENLVVLILWTIWVGFQIGRTVKVTLLFILKTLRWLTNH